MELINYTPFPHLVFESLTAQDREVGVLVVRGTFRLVQGAPLLPTVEQESVALRNVYRGDQAASSLVLEADIAPFKPRADIHVTAVARSPGSKSAAEWPVRIRVGTQTKDLLVRGPHEWYYSSILGWSKTIPRLCREVQLSYEYAFGGRFRVNDAPIYYDANPVGTGWIPAEAPTSERIRAPQVVALNEPEHAPGKRYIPQGCGPMLPNWSARLAHAGTFDDKWRARRSPKLPVDFNEAFYNSAHPDLIYRDGYLTGGEAIELVGLTAQVPMIRTFVPRYSLYAWIVYHHNADRAFGLVLDTLHIDVAADDAGAHRVFLTWRGRYPLVRRAQRLEIRMRDLGSVLCTEPHRREAVHG